MSAVRAASRKQEVGFNSGGLLGAFTGRFIWFGETMYARDWSKGIGSEARGEGREPSQASTYKAMSTALYVAARHCLERPPRHEGCHGEVGVVEMVLCLLRMRSTAPLFSEVNKNSPAGPQLRTRHLSSWPPYVRFTHYHEFRLVGWICLQVL